MFRMCHLPLTISEVDIILWKIESGFTVVQGSPYHWVGVVHVLLTVGLCVQSLLHYCRLRACVFKFLVTDISSLQHRISNDSLPGSLLLLEFSCPMKICDVF